MYAGSLQVEEQSSDSTDVHVMLAFSFQGFKMGNTSSERAGMERQGGHKASRGDASGGAISTKEGDRPKILMDSPEDADLFHSEEMKVSCVSALTS